MAWQLKELSREALAKSYTQPAVSAIYNQVQEFLPYESNFPSCRCFISKGLKSGPSVLRIETTLRISNGEVRVALSFPPQYPDQVLQAHVMLPERNDAQRLRIKSPYPVMDSNGMVQVECLAMLRGVERPFPLLDVLLALSEQFDVESPYTSEADAQQGQRNRSAQASSSALTNVLTTTSQDPRRTALIQEAAEKVVIDLNGKASAYLETREQSLFYLQRLNESNRELSKARDMLAKQKRELEVYLPSVGDVGGLVKKLETIPNTIEEHGRCLAAQSPAQERALSLLAEIHASEDTLALLEEGLKNDYFNVDEYVKCVSDVGREQFVARFLCQNILKELNEGAADSSAPGSGSGANSAAQSLGPGAAPPAIPQRLSVQEALRKEFTEADPDVIRDVLRNVNNDITVARQQLRSMYA